MEPFAAFIWPITVIICLYMALRMGGKLAIRLLREAKYADDRLVGCISHEVQMLVGLIMREGKK
jgi:hypothetical protein